MHHDKYKVDFVKSFLKTSSALSHLESELNKMLNFHAWDKQIEYFKQVKASFEGKTTSIQMDRIHVERLPIHLLFFVEDAIEQMLKDLESRFDDEAYESSAETSDSDDIETANLVDLDKHKTWKEALTAVFSNRVHKSVEFAFIEKTISVVLGYIAAMRDTNMDPSEAQFGFVQEDKQLKQALLEYTTSNQSKQKAMFLLAELHHISQKLIDSDTHVIFHFLYYFLLQIINSIIQLNNFSCQWHEKENSSLILYFMPKKIGMKWKKVMEKRRFFFKKFIIL